jgi:hypothetical protein
MQAIAIMPQGQVRKPIPIKMSSNTVETKDQSVNNFPNKPQHSFTLQTECRLGQTGK